MQTDRVHADAVPLRRAERPVPKFDANSYAPVPEISRRQRPFYDRDFRPGVLERDPVEVDRQQGYALMLFKELVEHLDDEPDVLADIRFMAQSYDGSGFPDWRGVLANTYFIDGDFHAGYLAHDYRVPIELHLSMAPYLGFPRISAESVFYWTEIRRLTRSRHGIGNYGAIMDTLQVRLDSFHDAHGRSLIDEYWGRLTAPVSRDEIATAIEEDLIGDFTRADVARFVEQAHERRAEAESEEEESEEPDEANEARLLDTYGALASRVEWPMPFVDTRPYWGLLNLKTSGLLRLAENETRRAAGVSGVGEGRIVAEIGLLRELEAEFPDEEIVHQARPYWLAPQSIDIYFVDRAIGVEYQGVQHSKPVEFFGGEAAFEVQQDRDAQKRAAFDDADHALIEVHPNYRLSEVVEQVRAAIEREELAVSAFEDAPKALSGERWSIVDALGHVRPEPGLYAIYGDERAWAELGLDPRHDVPLYVGKSEDSLAQRELQVHFAIDQDVSAQTGSSTVRRSFAALLRGQLGLRGIPRNPLKPAYFSNYGLSVEHDRLLTEWMHARLTVAVWHAADPVTVRLGNVELALIHEWTPPLNLKDNPQSLPALKAARRAMAVDARAWEPSA